MFGEWAKQIAPEIGPKQDRALKAWIETVTENVGEMAAKTPAEITTEDILGALKPYWTSRHETGWRMRQRIERILDAAQARGHITGPWSNPARWKGHL